MSKASDYLEKALVDHITKVAAYTVPTNLYLALFTGDPLDDGSGPEVSTAGTGYARVVANSWGAASARATSNSALIQFAEAIAPWGTITHVGIYDALTGGNLLIHGPLTSSKIVTTGQQVEFATGEVDIDWLAGGCTDYLANNLLDHVLKVAPYVQPDLYSALSTTSTSDDGTGLTEPGAGSYARKQISLWDAAVPVGNSHRGGNTNDEAFVTATADWGVIVSSALMDALVAGNMLTHGTLDSPQSVTNGSTFTWKAGQRGVACE